MAKPLSFGKIGVDFRLGERAAPSEARPDTPFAILVLGDFSGGAPARPLGERRPVFLDRDEFDGVLAGMAPTLSLPAEDGQALTLRFTGLDDFHPDRLYAGLDVFQDLRDLRKRLADPATFPKAAAEVRRRGEARESAEPPVNPENLLEHILGGPLPPADEGRRPPEPGGLPDFLRPNVAPYAVPKIDTAQQESLLSDIDEAAGRRMRALLHHPRFRALEAAWRAAFFLARRLDTDARLKLYLFDVSRQELADDLTAADDLGDTATYHVLVEKTVGALGEAPWAVVAGLYTFDATPEDAELLGRMARVARQAGAPFLAAADGRFPDEEGPAPSPEGEEAWQALRRLPEANSLGLALPRFLLRLPYGRDGSPAETFAFEELPPGAKHDDYLWGNPAAACTCLLGQAFSAYGWDLRPGAPDEIDDLPAHVHEEDGERLLKPCAEVMLSESAVEALLDRGLMPLLSAEGRGAARVARFQSLADPPAALAGRWQ